MQKDKSSRLDSEAAFQDDRVIAKEAGRAEPRDRYYFLQDRARSAYTAALGEVRGKRVLVVGCSDGGVTPLAKRGARVTGIDVSPVAIEKLRTAIASEGLQDLADAHVMDAEEPDFGPQVFDIICCTGVLHHLDTERAASAWSRLLRSEGRVVMMEPMAWHPAVMLFRAFTPDMRTPDEHPLRPRDISILQRSFSHVDVQGFVLFSLLTLLVPSSMGAGTARSRVKRVLERLDDWMLERIRGLVYSAWAGVIVLRHSKA